MKQTPEEYSQEQNRLQRLVSKFEDSLDINGNSSAWFDSEDIEDICNFYIDSGETSKAENALQAGFRLHPADSSMQMLRAHLFIEEYKPDEALLLLKQLNYTTDFYWHYLCLGAYADLKLWEQAEKEADEALKYDGDIVAATLDVARVFYDREKPQTALRYLLKADSINQNEIELWEAIAQCYIDLNQTDKALLYVEKMIDYDPYSIEFWQLRASLHIDINEFDLALEDFEYALAINPQSETTLVSKTKLLILLGRDEEAMQIVDELEQTNSIWADVCMILRGDIYFYRNDYRRAHACYYKGYRADNYIGESTLHYIECKIRLHLWKGVIKVGNDLLNFTPDDIKLLQYMADAYFELGQQDKCEEMLRHCLELKPDNVYILLRYGSLMLDNSNVDKAAAVIRKAWDISPDISQTNLLMAVISYLNNENSDMCHYLLRACETDDNARRTFLQLCPDAEAYIKGNIKVKRARKK